MKTPVHRRVVLVLPMSIESNRLKLSGIFEYMRTHAQWEKAGFWEDPHMGDPDFYYRKVEPLVIALNKEVKLLADGPDEATFERLWNERLETFAEFTLTVDALRRQWLEQELEQDF